MCEISVEWGLRGPDSLSWVHFVVHLTVWFSYEMVGVENLAILSHGKETELSVLFSFPADHRGDNWDASPSFPSTELGSGATFKGQRVREALAVDSGKWGNRDLGKLQWGGRETVFGPVDIVPSTIG